MVSYLCLVWRRLGYKLSLDYLFMALFSCISMYLYFRAIVLTYQEHLGVTYITLNEDPCPRMLIHNKCPIPLLLKENVKGRKRRTDGTWLLSSHLAPFSLTNFWGGLQLSIIWSFTETPRTEVHCRPLPANCSLHHELYHHYSSFPDCRQREVLPTLLLKTTSDHSTTDWTDSIDINCPGTQVKACL